MPLTLQQLIDQQNEIDQKIREIVAEILPTLLPQNEPTDEAKIERIAMKLAVKMTDVQKGDKGDSYVLTPSDKKEIASKITVPVVENTRTIVEQPIIKNQIKEIAIPETPEEVRDKLASLEGDNRLDASAIKNLPKQEVSSIVSVRGKNKQAYVTIYPSKIIGAIDGTNATFYLPQAPKNYDYLELYLDVGIMEPLQNFTMVGNQITFTFSPTQGQRIWAKIFRQ